MITPELITIIIIGLNAIVFALPYLGVANQQEIVQDYAVTPNISKTGEWYRLFTSNFIHLDVMHIVLNMYSLWQLHNPVFYFLQVFLQGKLQLILPVFVLLYVLSGIGGSLLSSVKTSGLSAGASGAIFGLFGFLLILSILTGQWGVVQSLTFVLALNIGIGLLPGSQIDNWGHLGGFLSGGVFGLVLFYLA
jgi:rhomboid protease GluP